ncbi:MAG: DUF4349 domain-containing protein [Myxococcota bacterium]
MKTPYLILLALAALSAGCMKKAAATEAPYYGDYGGEEVRFESESPADRPYADGDDLDIGGPLPHAEFAAPAPKPAMGQPSPDDSASPAVGGDHGGQPAVEDRTPPTAGRQIIYTATMAVSVFNVSEALELAEAVPERHGGWVATMNSETLVLKIPSKNLRAVMDELGKMGVVEYRTLESADVSDRYYDLETRIAVLEKTQTQMMDLLSKARNVTEALSVRKALDEITLELEVLKGQMRKLKNLVSFSTLTFTLTERGPHDPTPSSNDPFPWVDELGVEATEWR